jgi:raffinose/stachyose/melibiose transport system substrate-binding protein
MFRMPPMVDEAAQGNQNYVLMGPIALEGSAQTQYPDEVASFLNYFLSQETQKLFVEQTKRIPVRADALDGVEVTEELAFVVNDLATAEGAVMWLDVFLENRVSEAYLNSIQEVLAGSKTPEEVMAAIREMALAVKADLGL